MYFIDVQGTLIDDINRAPIAGAIEFIDYLNAQKIPYIVITNNTKRSSEDFLAYLQGLGFAIDAKKYLDPLMVLSLHVKDEKIAAFGSEAFIDLLKSSGYTLDYQEVETVLIAIKEDFTAQEYAVMIDALLAGAKLIGMHETTIYAKNAKRYPGVGAILKMLEFATSQPYSVVGKPSRTFYSQALEMLQTQRANASFDNITIISDDIKGDLVGAKKLGMKSVFVLSGKFKSEDEIVPYLAEDELADITCKSIGEYYENIR